MKSIIIGDKENNKIKKKREISFSCDVQCSPMGSTCYRSKKSSISFSFPSLDFSFVKSIGNSIKSFFTTKKSEESKPEISQNSKEKIDLNNKEDFMKVINTQDFISGFWDINEKTKIIKVKYEKEFETLKKIKGKKIDDKTAMTILIIYYIYKEHPELLKELVMIIKKAKLFIQEKIEDTYENIIKEININ